MVIQTEVIKFSNIVYTKIFGGKIPSYPVYFRVPHRFIFRQHCKSIVCNLSIFTAIYMDLVTVNNVLSYRSLCQVGTKRGRHSSFRVHQWDNSLNRIPENVILLRHLVTTLRQVDFIDVIHCAIFAAPLVWR